MIAITINKIVVARRPPPQMHLNKIVIAITITINKIVMYAIREEGEGDGGATCRDRNGSRGADPSCPSPMSRTGLPAGHAPTPPPP